MTRPSTHRRTRSPRGSGDRLRSEILLVARDLAAVSAAPTSVSLRAVADAVGVSATTIYHHFAHKQELLDAVMEDVFKELEASVELAAAQLDDPLEAVVGVAYANVRFALEHPGHYLYATIERPMSAPSKRPSTSVAHRARATLEAAVLRCVDSGLFSQVDVGTLALHLWTVAHGLAIALMADSSLDAEQALSFAANAIRAGASARPPRKD